VWVKGEVIRVEADEQLVVRKEDGTDVKARADEFPLQNLDTQGVEVNKHTCLLEDLHV
jgi:hypothetical protein